MKTPRHSRKLFDRALNVMPGGVSSPVRAFKAVGGSPHFIARARGAHITDIDGNTFIDYVGSWGPMIHGHAPRGLTSALARQAKLGTSFGAPSPLEVELAELVRSLVPSMERVRFVSSGTEATMSAARVARGATGRDKIIKFEGCYHGHADGFLVQAGSGALTFGTPTSPGVPAGAVASTLLASFNDLGSVERLIEANPGQIAGIIVEPVVGNMGTVLPERGFLAGLRTLADANRIVLIFDEVMTGFRVSAGGAQALYRITPDLTCLGKIVGGGLPVAAYGGRADLMDRVSPAGPIYQAGTLSGNPLAMVAGIWSLKRLNRTLYRKLSALGHSLAAGLADRARDAGIPLQVNALGSMLTPFFTAERVRDYRSAITSDVTAFATFFREMLARGIYLPPSQYEAWFISGAHTPRDIAKTVSAAHEAFSVVAKRTKETSAAGTTGAVKR